MNKTEARRAKAQVKTGKGAGSDTVQETLAALVVERVALPDTKLERLCALLRRPEGARIEELMAATGWQKHSVRGAMAGTLKKKRGLTVLSEKSDGALLYRIPAAT